ncbi:MAG: hypothetical protein OXG60_07265 [Chloroflexi bacterium]|nr:hypothetical protein [Chloroflexota bacterium]
MSEKTFPSAANCQFAGKTFLPAAAKWQTSTLLAQGQFPLSNALEQGLGGVLGLGG